MTSKLSVNIVYFVAKFQKFGPRSIREHNKYLKYSLVDEKQHALHKICGNYEILV